MVTRMARKTASTRQRPQEVRSWHVHRTLSTNKDIMLEALTPTMEGHAVTVTDNHRHLGVVLSEDLKMVKACTVHFGSSI